MSWPLNKQDEFRAGVRELLGRFDAESLRVTHFPGGGAEVIVTDDQGETLMGFKWIQNRKEEGARRWIVRGVLSAPLSNPQMPGVVYYSLVDDRFSKTECADEAFRWPDQKAAQRKASGLNRSAAPDVRMYTWSVPVGELSYEPVAKPEDFERGGRWGAPKLPPQEPDEVKA